MENESQANRPIKNTLQELLIGSMVEPLGQVITTLFSSLRTLTLRYLEIAEQKSQELIRSWASGDFGGGGEQPGTGEQPEPSPVQPEPGSEPGTVATRPNDGGSGESGGGDNNGGGNR